MSVLRTPVSNIQHAVEDVAAHLYVWALKDIPQDLRDALADAAGKETSVPGQRVLQTILKNVQVADTEKNLVCQDTGIAVYTCKVGEHFPLHPARIYEALRDGTARATLEHPLRSNAVHTVTRENTGPNIGHRLPIVDWEFVPDWDGLDVKCVPKGSGSENMSFLPGVRKLDDGRYEKVCIGTTTSARMVRFTEPLGKQYGVRAICGNGGFPDEAVEPMQKHGMVYFAIVGGAAAFETTQIEEIAEVAWEELMPECLWKFRVKDFGPLTVGIDAHGNSLYHDVQAAAQERLEEIFARL